MYMNTYYIFYSFIAWCFIAVTMVILARLFQYYFQFTIGCIVPRMSTDGVQFLNCSVVSRNNKQMLCLDEFIY